MQETHPHGNRFRDLTGQQFGRLTVLSEAGRCHRYVIWLCRCYCGETVPVISGNLVRGHTRSCGCLRREETARRQRIQFHLHPLRLSHGHARAGHNGHSRSYISWAGAVARCESPATIGWHHYGGANPPVQICERWRHSFENFLADMGERPEGTTLGRYLDIGNYEPGNCAWQTRVEQGAERRGKHAMLKLHAHRNPVGLAEAQRKKQRAKREQEGSHDENICSDKTGSRDDIRFDAVCYPDSIDGGNAPASSDANRDKHLDGEFSVTVRATAPSGSLDSGQYRDVSSGDGIGQANARRRSAQSKDR